MKRAFYKKFAFSFFLLLCLFWLNSGCGLDVFVVIEPPHNVVNQPNDESSYESAYFEFWTNETGETEFRETAVYYKIYNSLSALKSETSSLTTIANDSENSYNAPTRLTVAYNYKTLRAKNLEDSLIPYTGKNKKVYVRLSDYLGQEEYSAQIKIDNAVLTAENGAKKIPLRNVSSTATFNFFGSTADDKLPNSDDEDVKYNSGAGENGVWYVAMFAVAVGQDTMYSPIYSNILYLGSVKISESDTKS